MMVVTFLIETTSILRIQDDSVRVFQMVDQEIPPIVIFTAEIAAVQFIFGVASLVVLKIASGCELLLASIVLTMIWSFASVNPLVNSQISSLVENTSTSIKLAWKLNGYICVLVLQMNFKPLLPWKFVVADQAFEVILTLGLFCLLQRLFSRVIWRRCVSCGLGFLILNE